jgi:guanylate kinase/deoxycytidine triphosphate deaminase
MGFFRARKDIFIQEGMNMEYKGIIITGTSGAGKSTIAGRLCEKFKEFQVVQAATTRKPREDDYLSMYQYMSKEEFDKIDTDKELLTKAKYRGEYYGITYQALHIVLDNSRVPILILTPESTKSLEEDSKERGKFKFFIFFFDAPDDVLKSRLVERGEKINENVEKQRREDRIYGKDCLYVISNTGDADIEDTAQLIYSLWGYRDIGGMLPKKVIELMVKSGMLLKNAEIKNNVSGASFDLSLGGQYWQDGKRRMLDNTNPFLELKPGDYAIVSSKETADFPRDIAGRFDLSVSLFCQGIILSNGPQVDPGFKGGLFCLLFNTSNATIRLKQGQHYATIEFIKLLEPTIAYSGEYQGKDNIIDYLHYLPEPSVITKIKEDIDALKSAKWWEKTIPLILSILAIVAAIVLPAILSFIKK